MSRELRERPKFRMPAVKWVAAKLHYTEINCVFLQWSAPKSQIVFATIFNRKAKLQGITQKERDFAWNSQNQTASASDGNSHL